jgi:hypothetical protein
VVFSCSLFGFIFIHELVLNNFSAMQYLPKLLKTMKTNIFYCNVEAMQQLVGCFLPNEVNKFKILLLHRRSFSEDKLSMFKDH